MTRSVDRERSPGEALLLASARPGATTAPLDAIADLARDPHVEWTPTMDLAHWHGVAPRLARSLVVSGVAGDIPRAVDDDLQSGYMATMARNLMFRRELGAIVEELHRHEVEVMVLKGAALVPLVHRDPGVRPMDDLDLLVHADDLERAEKIITATGYRSSDKSPATTHVDEAHHHLPSLVRADGAVTIELHHKLGSSGSPPDFDVSGVWARAVPFDADDAACLRPSDEDLLAHVALHFLVDRVRLFSRRALRQVCDIGATIDACSDALEWDRLIDDAAERGYATALALALGTAAAVVDARVPDDVLTSLGPDGIVPSVPNLTRRRVLRDPSWTSLERLTARQPSVLHLVPPNPQRWSPAAEAPPPTERLVAGYREWLVASTRIIQHPGELAAERRFASELQALVFPHGLPDGSGARRWVRRRVQARLGAS